MASSEEATLVLVTGVSGYIGSHVAQLMQNEGYRVRGSVRSLENEDSVKWLKELCPEAKYEIELVEADLLKEESWTSAVKDCAFVIHIASPFPKHNVANVEEELIKPAVEGTKFILKACAASGTVRRVILTSSAAAVHGEPVVEEGKVYTEEDWTNLDSTTLDDYSRSKTLAEKAAWDFVKELKDEEKFELAVINPGLVLGPVINKNIGTSVEVVKRLMDRSMPAVPKVNFFICDVRDVALAHYKAMITPDAADHRHIIATQSMWMKEIAQILSKELKSQGYNVPTFACPYFALWVTGLFDKSVKMLLPRVGKEIKFDNSRMKDILGITPTEASATILDTSHSLIDRGIIKKSKKYKGAKKGSEDQGTSEEKTESELHNGDVKEGDENEKSTKDEKTDEKTEEQPAKESEKTIDSEDDLKKDIIKNEDGEKIDVPVAVEAEN